MVWSGAALAAGGLTTALVNLGLTPFMPREAPFAEVAASSLFLWRQSASALAAAFLLFGSVGLYLRQADRLGLVGMVAFLAAFFGSALLLAWEWVDVFVLGPLAVVAPSALATLDGAEGLDRHDLGALIPVTLFTLGWLTLAAVTLRARRFRPLAPWFVIAGFFLTPLLTGVVGPWGA